MPVWLTEVKIPPFTKNRKRLEKVDVDWNRELSSVQIHIKQVIGVLKQKYQILQGVLPIGVIHHKDEDEASVDKLVRVCAALVNLYSTSRLTENNSRQENKGS